MNELLKIEMNENQEPVIRGRELHEFLKVETPYRKWFPRMCEYGFVENIDYTPDIFVHPLNSQDTVDHLLKLDMAKELAMIQRTEKGKQGRQYFIQIEKEYNSPEKIMARALQIAEKELSNLRLEVKIKDQQIAEYEPKVDYCSKILQSTTAITISQIAKDYGMSAQYMNKLLHDLKVQYKERGTWLLYTKYQDKGYTKTKTTSFEKNDGSIGSSVTTCWTQKGRMFLYELLKDNNIIPLMDQEGFEDEEN